MKEKLSPLIRKHLIDVSPYQPGKPVEEVKRELKLDDVIKLASNENLLGVSKKALKALRKYLKEANYYPDDSCFYLKKKLAKIHDVKEDEIILGNGSVELLYYLVFTFADESVSIAYNKGAFAMYPIVSKISNAQIIEVPLKKGNLACDPIAILKKIKENTRIIFLSNPNNPTGTSFTHDEAEELLKNVKENTLVVFDEAYTHFVESENFPDSFSLYRRYKNLIILRTLSKAYGLAGLRIGYLIARPEIINSLNKVKVPFNVNRLVQIAALHALDDDEFVEKTKKLIKKEKRYLYKEFEKLNLFYLKSDTNFIFVKFKMKAKEIFEKLLKRGIITRPLPESLFPNALRITIGRRKENKKLISALNEILKE